MPTLEAVAQRTLDLLAEGAPRSRREGLSFDLFRKQGEAVWADVKPLFPELPGK